MATITASLGIDDRLPDQWRRPTFKPQCTHISMSRFYGPDLICDYCRRPGQFGWVYRCSQDREEVIDLALSRGYPSTFDLLGDQLASRVGLRKRSRAARESSLSFFDEITPQQMINYRPDQIATILKQRDNVHAVIAAEEARKNLSSVGHRSDFPPHTSYHYRVADPWSELLESECEYQICPQCRPGAADRAFLSLNAVADNEIMPCAAIGFGFHIEGGRPVSDVRVVRNLGVREEATAFTDENPSEGCCTPRDRFLDLLHGQIDRLSDYDDWEDDSDGETGCSLHHRKVDDPPTRLKHSPRYENLSVFVENAVQASEGTKNRPWTPPPSPRPIPSGSHVDETPDDLLSPNKAERHHAWRRQRMIQELDRIYEFLGDRQSIVPVASVAREDMVILKETAEIGLSDIIKQV